MADVFSVSTPFDAGRAAPKAPPRASLEGVQVLRGVAAFAVLVHHTLEELSGAGLPEFVTRVGASGVDLFFVISGFIMLHTAGGQLGAPGAGRDFLTRRLIRIAPLYWLLTAFVVVCHAAGLAYVNRPMTPGSVVNSLLFLPTEDIVVNVGWTLNYEMYFYALFALCLALGRSVRAAIAAPAMILTGLALGHLFPEGPWREFLTNRIALEFAFGMGLAALVRTGRVSPRLRGVAMSAGVAGLIAASALAPADGTEGLDSSVRFLFWGLPAALVVYGALGVQRVRTRAGRAWLALGDASYSLYLTHTVVMITFAKLLKIPAIDALPAAVLFTGAVTAAVIVGQLSYMLVERPLTEGLKALWVRRRLAAA